MRGRIVLGVTGSIAAYKSAEIVRSFTRQNFKGSQSFEVRCIMTESATRFITPLTLETLSGNPVTTDFWSERGEIGHIGLADWAEVVLIAPATADIIAKLANGNADTPLAATVLATKAPICIAPAMNVNMWENVATQENVARLKSRGVSFIEPSAGELACGWEGGGRLAPYEHIYEATLQAITPQTLAGKHIVVTAGPTEEEIDPVRYISNRSSGKMGIALAKEAFRRGGSVTLIHGPINLPVLPRSIKTAAAVSAKEMGLAVQAAMPSDMIIMAAAVSDFYVANSVNKKIKRSEGTPQIKLEKNPDILRTLSENRSGPTPLLVGFAVETGDEAAILAAAKYKLQDKKVDIVVGNLASESLGLETNRVVIVDRTGHCESLPTASKEVVARQIFDRITALCSL